MAGPTKADVMYALLALDSYNRNESNDSLRLLSENNAAEKGARKRGRYPFLSPFFIL
jgi:hypothetical protein